uniref:Putative transporter RBE_0856 n=1 Tax=Lygus hesperus TaxID=30085 RepID=A0A0A9WGY9_LYGHE
MPRVPKAALNVYTALMQLHDRLDICRAKVNPSDITRLLMTLERAGLYNIFLGAFLMKEAHLTAPSLGSSCNTTTPASSRVRVGQPIHAFPTTLNPVIERVVHEKLMSKLTRAKVSA